MTIPTFRAQHRLAVANHASPELKDLLAEAAWIEAQGEEVDAVLADRIAQLLHTPHMEEF